MGDHFRGDLPGGLGNHERGCGRMSVLCAGYGRSLLPSSNGNQPWDTFLWQLMVSNATVTSRKARGLTRFNIGWPILESAPQMSSTLAQAARAAVRPPEPKPNAECQPTKSVPTSMGTLRLATQRSTRYRLTGSWATSRFWSSNRGTPPRMS